MKVELRAGVSRPKGERHGERGFHDAFEEHFDAVMAYAIRRSASRAEAEDVVAETFVVAWRRWHERPDRLLPWLYGIARRVLSNARRANARREALVIRVGSAVEPYAFDHADKVISDVDLRHALGRVSEADREAIFLTEWEGLSPRDAARVLGCTTAAFHVRLFRARRRLLAQLECHAEPSQTLSSEEA